MITLKNPAIRRSLRIIIPCLLLPGAIALGLLPIERRYALSSLAVTVLALLLFLCGFESKKTGSRRLVLVAIITAMAVAGRFIPLVKPVTALTILAAIYLGGEAGFAVGAFSALISNFYFGQGPWTPFQMAAWGLIGLLGGALSKPLVRSRALLIVYGAISGMVFSLVMDTWSVLWYSGGFSAALFAAAFYSALPFTLLYAVSNAAFLWLLGRPFGRRLERIKKKYSV